MAEEEVRFRVSVRGLVEEVLRAGDLGFGGGSQRLLEGAQGHRALQAEGGACNELPVSGEARFGGLCLTVHGRIDRLFERPLPIVEEIKTSLRPLDSIGQDDYPLHWAQAKVYAYLYLQRKGLERAQVRLCYYQLHTAQTLRFTRVFGLEELQALFDSLTQAYLAARAAELDHAKALRLQLRQAAFPYAAYRPGQRELAAQVYVALRDGERLLVQAPTGTGKTMAVLFPALKALAEGRCEKLFYLSARGTGKAAALEAVRRLGLSQLRCLELSAKAELCPFDRPDCAGTEGPCPYTLGYYDRLSAALEALLALPGPYTHWMVAQTALEHQLCPHEFSLDLSLACDLVVCDYNYAFDPRVRLQRFFTQGKTPFALLLDEAHNLPARAREMYSEDLRAEPLEALRKAAPRGAARKLPAYLALRELLRLLEAEFEGQEAPFALEGPPGEPLRRAVEEVVGLLQAGAYPRVGDLGEISLMLSGFLYAAARWDENMLRLYEGGKGRRCLRLFCRDASPFLQRDLGRFRAAVLFSATLSPKGFYQRLCGLQPEDRFLSLPSPFPPENLCCLHLPLNTRYQQRERTLPLAARAVVGLARSRPKGNFLAFCPSYAYLQALLPLLRELAPEVRLLVQERRMDASGREAFLEGFLPEPEGRVLGLAVLGGVFAEGVDLPGERLCGAAVIGVGLPQLGPETELLRARFEESYGDGYAYAYLYPGLCRVLQAGGRLIRSPTDRGALLLMDDRYARDPYPQLLPAHWQLRRVGSLAGLQRALQAFWAEA